MKYRISARGILEQNHKILFARYEMNSRRFYALPGGQQIIGETLEECVQREFLEETGLEVKVGKLVLVNEFIEESSAFVEDWKDGIHQVEMIFEVTLESADAIGGKASSLDPGMVKAEWLSRTILEEVEYYPAKSLDWFFSEKIGGNEALYRGKRH